MSTNNHTAISVGAAANAGTINAPLGELDAAIDATILPFNTAFDFNTATERMGLWKVAGSYGLDVGGSLNATALSVNGTPVGSSSDTYFDAVTGGITYGSKVGIGTGATEPAAPMEVVGTAAASIYSTVDGTIGGGTIHRPNQFVATIATDADGGTIRNVWASTTVTGTHDVTTMAGFYAQTYDERTAALLTHGWGAVARFYKTGNGGDVTLLAGIYSDFIVTGSGDIAQASGFYQNPAIVSAGTIAQAFMADFNEPDVTGTGVVEDNYGIRIGATTVGTESNYGLYIEQSAGYGIYNVDGDFYSNGNMTLIGDMDLTGDLAVADGNVSIIAADVLGSDLVANGAFTSDTASWAAGGSGTLASIAGGQAGNCLEVTNAGGIGYATQTLTTVVGQRYRLTLYYKNGTATQGAIYIGTTSGGSELSYTALATAAAWTARTFDFTATTTTTYLRLSVSGSTVGHTMLFDTVVVQSLLGGTLGVNAKITGYGGTAGIAISPASGEMTADHRVIAKAGFRTDYAIIADDAVIDLRSLYPNLAVGGLLLISSVGLQNTAGIISYRSASTPFCTVVAQPSTDIVVGTTALTAGAGDGTDAKLNIAALSTGELYVKNRRGTSATFTFTLLN